MKKLLSLYFIMLLLFFNACDMLTTADVEFSDDFKSRYEIIFS
jgi:hypothetical protein